MIKRNMGDNETNQSQGADDHSDTPTTCVPSVTDEEKELGRLVSLSCLKKMNWVYVVSLHSHACHSL